MARLYSNENFPLPVVQELRRRGHDVLTVAESGNAGRQMTDLEVLRFAIGQSRAVITLNRRHFVALHHSDPRHHGIIVCTVDADFAAMADRIDAFLRAEGDLAGKLLRVNRPA